MFVTDTMFQKLTLSIPSWLNLEKETLHTQEDWKKWSFSLSCNSICRFQGVYDICFKTLAVPSHRACSMLERLFPEGCSVLTRGNGFLIHQKMLYDGAMAHGSTSAVPQHTSLMSSVPFQENYTRQIPL